MISMVRMMLDRLFACLCVCLLVCLFVHSHSFVRLFVRLFVCVFGCVLFCMCVSSPPILFGVENNSSCIAFASRIITIVRIVARRNQSNYQINQIQMPTHYAPKPCNPQKLDAVLFSYCVIAEKRSEQINIGDQPSRMLIRWY